jgi:uncharacterized Ntn-hydrolase superfamily protein
MARCILAMSLSGCALVVTLPALATYSTVAMERSTGRYGVVTASCVQLSVLQRVYASFPGHGAVLTQSYLVEGDASQALALQLLGQGADAAEVVDAMTDPQFDTDFSLRQYVVLDADGGFAGFSGLDARPFAGHLDVSGESFSVGIAGNLLTGAGVLEAAALGFWDKTGCDFEEHLLNALVASSQGGLGDARCVEEGRPAQSAWLHVAGSNGEGDLDIAVDAAPGIDPTVEVVTRFSEWRSNHPCPVELESSNTPPVSAPSDHPTYGCAMAHDGGGTIGRWVWLLLFLGRRRASATP